VPKHKYDSHVKAYRAYRRELKQRLIKKWVKEMAVRLTKAREARGLTQAQLGERANIAWAQVSHYENGVRPTVDNLRKLAVALDVSIDWLVGLTNRGPEP